MESNMKYVVGSLNRKISPRKCQNMRKYALKKIRILNS